MDALASLTDFVLSHRQQWSTTNRSSVANESHLMLTSPPPEQCQDHSAVPESQRHCALRCTLLNNGKGLPPLIYNHPTKIPPYCAQHCSAHPWLRHQGGPWKLTLCWGTQCNFKLQKHQHLHNHSWKLSYFKAQFQFDLYKHFIFTEKLTGDKELQGANSRGSTGSAFVIINDWRKRCLHLIARWCGKRLCWATSPTLTNSSSNFSALHCHSFLSEVSKKK